MVMTTSWSHTIRVIVFSVLLGGASGVLATALTTSYLSDYAIQLSELTEPLRIAEQRPTAFPASYEEAVEQLVSDALPAMAQLGSTTNQPLSLNDPELSPVTVLTSDGWMLTMTSGTLKSVVIKNELCDVVDQVEDSITGVVFIKCDARSLSVAGFGSGYDMEAGYQVFVADSSSSFTPADVLRVSWPSDTAWSSDIPNRRFVLSVGTVPSIGSAVFDLSSKLVGIVEEISDNGEVIVLPLDSFLEAFDSLLENGDVVHATLGVQAIDLSKTIVSSELSREYSTGALLYGTQAVVYRSAAYDAGLLAGDIILSVDRQSVDDGHSLDEYITTHVPGDQVLLQIDRDGSLIDVSVTLGE